VFLPAYSTHALQPLDVAIFGNFKNSLKAVLAPLQRSKRYKQNHGLEWSEVVLRMKKPLEKIDETRIQKAWVKAGFNLDGTLNGSRMVQRLRLGNTKESLPLIIEDATIDCEMKSVSTSENTKLIEFTVNRDETLNMTSDSEMKSDCKENTNLIADNVNKDGIGNITYVSELTSEMISENTNNVQDTTVEDTKMDSEMNSYEDPGRKLECMEEKIIIVDDTIREDSQSNSEMKLDSKAPSDNHTNFDSKSNSEMKIDSKAPSDNHTNFDSNKSLTQDGDESKEILKIEFSADQIRKSDEEYLQQPVQVCFSCRRPRRGESCWKCSKDNMEANKVNIGYLVANNFFPNTIECNQIQSKEKLNTLHQNELKEAVRKMILDECTQYQATIRSLNNKVNKLRNTYQNFLSARERQRKKKTSAKSAPSTPRKARTTKETKKTKEEVEDEEDDEFSNIAALAESIVDTLPFQNDIVHDKREDEEDMKRKQDKIESQGNRSIEESQLTYTRTDFEKDILQ